MSIDMSLGSLVKKYRNEKSKSFCNTFLRFVKTLEMNNCLEFLLIICLYLVHLTELLFKVLSDVSLIELAAIEFNGRDKCHLQLKQMKDPATFISKSELFLGSHWLGALSHGIYFVTVLLAIRIYK